MLKRTKYFFIVFILGTSLIFTGCSSPMTNDDPLHEDYENYEDYGDEEYLNEDYAGEDYQGLDEYQEGDYSGNQIIDSDSNNPGNAISSSANPIIGIVDNVNTRLELQSYQLPGVFTMLRPKGWSVYKGGEYNTIAFLTRDDKEPLRQVFCFSEIGLFYVDENQKRLEEYYHYNGGYPVQWIDMPVISPFDGTTFYKNFNTILESQIARNFLTAANMPKPSGFEQIEIISEQPIDSIYPGIPSALVRAILVQNGKAAQGMFVVSGVTDGLGHASALMVTGITAPLREYPDVQSSLLDVAKSFKLDPGYVQQGLRTIQENNERLGQISKTLSETSDIITKGWEERSRIDDILVEKKGDQILGVERVYDPDTGEVYEVENGFYDYYQTHQDQYTLKNLQPLPDNDAGLWGQAPRINHGLVIP